MLQRNPEVVEWDKRLREAEARRKKEVHSDQATEWVALPEDNGEVRLLPLGPLHSDEYREWLDPLSETRVVQWVAHPENGFLFDPTDEANHKMIDRHSSPSPHSEREAAGRRSLDGEPLSGNAVPAPHPKVGRRKRARPAAMAHPELLRFAFYARCYARLGYIGIKTGKGNKPAHETTLLSRFLFDYYRAGWPQSYLGAATGRSRANVAKHIASERAEVARLLNGLTPPVLPFPPRATESNLKWCPGTCPRHADEGLERTYIASDGKAVDYVVSSTWTWNDGKQEVPWCSHCYGLVSKLPADLDQPGTGARSGQDSSPLARCASLSSPDATRSEIQA